MLILQAREALGEIVGGVILVALGIVWAVVAGEYGLLGEGGRLAPGTLPFACGVTLAITGAVIAIKSVITARGRRNSDADAPEGAAAADDDAVSGAAALISAGNSDDTITEVGAASVPTAVEVTDAPTTLAGKVRALPTRYPVLTVYLLVMGGVALMPVLGFAASFAIAIFAILRLVERQPILRSATVGIVTALLGYLLFEVIFNLPLPEPFFL